MRLCRMMERYGLFQSTPLREGRPEVAEIIGVGKRFQSTPLREGRRRSVETICSGREVSIHAPARGATIFACSTIHYNYSFNPRPCARGDFHRDNSQSFHQGFNPRPCARGDFVSHFYQFPSYSFQSTPLREGRPCRFSRSYRNLMFQSTPLREGRLYSFPGRPPVLSVSIHAPARGATMVSAVRHNME